MPAIPATIDFDGDLVSLTTQGQSADIYACDFVDEVFEEISQKDKEQPLPGRLDEETGEVIAGSHSRGDAFVAILRGRLKDKGLDVNGRRAIAIWRTLVKKTEEYRSFFENGPSSRPSSDAHHPESLADEAASALLSKKGDESRPASD